MAEGGNFNEKTKHGPRKCETCKITFDDVSDYADHLESKEHLKEKMKEKFGKRYLEAKAQLLGENADVVKVNTSDSEDEDYKVFTCTVCNKLCTGAVSYKLHLAGKKHFKNLKNADALEELQVKSNFPKDIDDDDSIFPDSSNIFKASEILCKVCNKKCSGAQSYRQHQQSGGHKKKLAMEKLKEEMAEKMLKPKVSDSDEEEEQSEFARCTICCKSFSGPVPYMQHMESPVHQKQARYTKQMTKIKNLIVTSECSNKFHCKQCDKSFSGPIPFQTHMKSAAHQKVKLKMDLIEKLVKEFKDLVIMSSEDGDMYTCETCHTAFSGPESAQDHFSSPKHLKAEREKKRIENLKILKNSKKTKSKSIRIDDNTSSCKDDESDRDSENSFDVIE